MDPPEKKKRGLWTESQLKLAVEAVHNRQMSQRKAAAVYSIPRRTLRNHLKSGSTTKSTGRHTTLSKMQEKDLTKRIIRLAHVGVPLTPRLVRKQAYEFCIANNIPNYFNDSKNTAGKKWLKGFIKRNPEVSVRKAQFMNHARAQKLNKPIVMKHFEAVKKIYDELDISNHPERLYNIDEKGCRLTLHHQQKVFAKKGTKRVHFVAQEHAENVTIAMCVNATGNVVPPMILFKGKRLKPEYCDNLPSGSLVQMAPKGSMTTELFVKFIAHLAKYKSPGRCLLIFDGASSHLDARIVDEADKHNIILYCLPSNTTHELQPLDKSVNKSYEHHWDEEVLLYAYQYPERNITKSRFGKIFTKVWSKCMTQGNIINGFRSTGLYPYNPSAIPDEAYAPSVLTEISQPQLQNLPSIRDSPTTAVPRHDDDISDSDVTVCEDNLQNLSPSLLHHNDKLLENDIDISSIYTVSKLVDYSSSSDSIVENEHCRIPSKEIINRTSDFLSPVPSTSGVNGQFRPWLNFSLSDSSLSEEFDTALQNISQPRRANNTMIYTSSSSETEEGNVNISRQRDTTPPREVSENSDDNSPFSQIKEADQMFDANVKTSFHKQIPTPNYATVKSQPRRKALNYIGQKITKHLFNETKQNKNKEKQLKENNIKIKDKALLKNKKRKLEQCKNKEENPKKAGNNETKAKKKKGNSKPEKTSKKDFNNEAWYCLACNVERIADMRRCGKCSSWYHEDCVGLTREDLELFVCPACT